MYFKKLEIFGFKSFADKTVLNFGSGITAVVGPNGCGKSNIFDSIRWVLGEQSYKELRGSSMEDVIFSGTDKKSGLGFAEVSLTFSNESKMLPLEYDEVTVTRRLFRSGESEYLLNKSVVRLKDINELFMGTGIGAEAYSLVQQGKVDLVVSARPEDRRIILDEAAGITKYKSKKKEALSKLKDTEDNLLRINDIVIEVKRQIASIERQANKARRYKEEFEKLKVCEVALTRLQLSSFTQERGRIQEKLDQLKTRETQIQGEIEEFNNLIMHEEGLLTDVEQRINDVSAEEIKIENQIDIEQRQIGFNDERLENLAQNGARLQQQKNQLTERCRTQQEKIEELKAALSTLHATLAKNQTELQSQKEALGVIHNLIHSHKENIRKNEEKVLDLTSRQVKIKNEMTEVMKELQGAIARKRRLEMENTKVLAEKQEVDQKLESIKGEITAALRKMTDVKVHQGAKEQTLKELKDRLAALELELGELERKRLLLASQKEFIEKLRVQYEDIPDPVVEGRFITQTPPQERHSGIIGKVKGIQVLSEEVKKFLSSNSNVPADATLYEVLCETKFIELDPQEILGRISEVSLRIETENACRQEIIGRINEEQAEMDRLQEAVRAEEKSLSILESQRGDIGKESEKLVGELEVLDFELKEVNELYSSLKQQEDQLSGELNVSNQEIVWCQQDIRDKQSEIEVKTRERESTTVAIAQLETELGSFQDKEKGLTDNVTLFQQGLDEALGEIKQVDDELAESQSKQLRIQEETQTLLAKIDEIREKKNSLKSVLSGHEKQKAEMTQRLNSMRRQITAYEDETENLHNETHEQQLKQQQLGFSEQGIKDRLLQTYKINLDEWRDPWMVAAESPAEPSAGTAEGSAGAPVSAAVAEGEALPAAVSPSAAAPAVPAFVIPQSPDELVAEIERLKKRCDSFGAVNLVAIDEFEELRQRFEFLTKQQSDLLTAKESLHQTIQKINRTTRQMFMDTFTKVSEEFRIYFRMLFGGGEAQLVLLDPENVLESGIEIIARPPGKKLQNISLLSGGEKTLTAIALVFGVFKVRPSPFCVLDEIDAALDESNVGRFGYLLKEFAKIAQFIVITHNKKTIAQADVMYGITMQETGVSKIVSVKFAGDEKKSEENQEVEVGV